MYAVADAGFFEGCVCWGVCQSREVGSQLLMRLHVKKFVSKCKNFGTFLGCRGMGEGAFGTRRLRPLGPPMVCPWNVYSINETCTHTFWQQSIDTSININVQYLQSMSTIICYYFSDLCILLCYFAL